MTDHYAEAVRLLADRSGALTQTAQVHATLALVDAMRGFQATSAVELPNTDTSWLQVTSIRDAT